ncbi:MAG TPA: (Fe-S)-binding protein [Vicinamibacterales bacterium]|nr:(Fe-S)-binding protein [Vicinamibacterales bacterium]
MATLQLFHTCLVNEFFPNVGFAVVRVLEHLGFAVNVPLRQTCCGQPAFNGGFHDDARVAARHTLEVLGATAGAIVIPSGSCADMLIHQYPVLFAGDQTWRTRADRVAARCREFSAFAAEHLHGPLGEVQTTVAYHPSCHLARGLGIDREPRAVIAAIGGIHLRHVDADDECCGFGGLFAIKHGDISARMLDRKMSNVCASGADRLVSCDMGCLLHIGGGLHRRGAAMKVQHLAELAAEALK